MWNWGLQECIGLLRHGDGSYTDAKPKFAQPRVLANFIYICTSWNFPTSFSPHSIRRYGVGRP
jgi:hypothetical protein